MFKALADSNKFSSDFPIYTGIPARLHVEQVAQILGFQSHDIPILISRKLLKPLGNPAPNAPKFFAAVEIVALMSNIDWLSRSTKALAEHWRKKNSKNGQKQSPSAQSI